MELSREQSSYREVRDDSSLQELERMENTVFSFPNLKKIMTVYTQKLREMDLMPEDLDHRAIPLQEFSSQMLNTFNQHFKQATSPSLTVKSKKSVLSKSRRSIKSQSEKSSSSRYSSPMSPVRSSGEKPKVIRLSKNLRQSNISMEQQTDPEVMDHRYSRLNSSHKPGDIMLNIS